MVTPMGLDRLVQAGLERVPRIRGQPAWDQRGVEGSCELAATQSESPLGPGGGKGGRTDAGRGGVGRHPQVLFIGKEEED